MTLRVPFRDWLATLCTAFPVHTVVLDDTHADASVVYLFFSNNGVVAHVPGKNLSLQAYAKLMKALFLGRGKRQFFVVAPHQYCITKYALTFWYNMVQHSSWCLSNIVAHLMLSSASVRSESD